MNNRIGKTIKMLIKLSIFILFKSIISNTTEKESLRILVISNRGPIEYNFDKSGLITTRDSDGGLATVLYLLAKTISVNWLANARTDADRIIAGNSTNIGERSTLRLLGLSASVEKLHYKLCNTALWFLQHSILNKLNPSELVPNVIYDSWNQGYLPVNIAFADSLKDYANNIDAIMIHDYHFYALPLLIRKSYPKLFLQYFIHIPWPAPKEWAKLPIDITKKIFKSLLANNSMVFQTKESVENFLQGCSCFLPKVKIDRNSGIVTYNGRQAHIWSNPVSIDISELEKEIAKKEAEPIRKELKAISDKQIILRVDRLDPIKNIDLGFEAFSLLLEEHPELREKVVFFAQIYPSRLDIKEYIDYGTQILKQIDQINLRFGQKNWKPIVTFYEQNRLKALVAMTLYDVLFVNSLADGLNLVSKEGVALNKKNGVLVLSKKAGSYDELGHAAIGISPYNKEETAQALYQALTMPKLERKKRALELKNAIVKHQSKNWISALVEDIRQNKQ